MKKEIIIISAIIIVGTAIIWNGFNKYESRIESCSTEYIVYIDAKYSETTSGIDMDGSLYTDTDYWSEQVSDTWEVKTKNGELVSYSCPSDVIIGVKCSKPPITYKHSKTDFDNYSTVKSLKCYVDYGSGDYSKVSVEDYNIAIKNIGNKVTVKEFYGNAYNFEIWIR